MSARLPMLGQNEGEYMTEKEAVQEGYQAANGSGE